MITADHVSDFQMFDGLTRQEIEAVLVCGEVASFAKNQVIITESQMGLDLYLLLAGSADVEIEVSYFLENTNEHVARLRPGEVFGEIGFLEGTKRSAHVIAGDDIDVVKFRAGDLEDLFAKHPRIGYLVMKNLGRILATRLMDATYASVNPFPRS